MTFAEDMDELDKLIKETGLTVTFDRFRDNTKGCGPHCKGWTVGPRTEWCTNHKAAIERGEYVPNATPREPHCTPSGRGCLGKCYCPDTQLPKETK